MLGTPLHVSQKAFPGPQVRRSDVMMADRRFMLSETGNWSGCMTVLRFVTRNLWYNMHMVKIARGFLLAGLAVVSTSACASFHAEALPPSDFADTEASTNVCLDVTQVLSVGDNFRFFDVALELAATPTNNVEIGDGRGDCYDVFAAVEYGAGCRAGRGCLQ